MTASKVGKYALIRELGRGGMGVVYLAEDETLRRKVAVKVLASHLALDRAMVARFLTEARAMAAMQHPHIVSVYEAGEDEGTPFFAMEYLEGEDLGQLLARSGRLAFPQALTILTSVASALDYAHTKGVIHRDIKPGNVLLTSDGVAKVTDFGIARIAGESGHTATGMLVGTPAYMAPELWNGQSPTPASDLYSLGILAYELLSGRPPFEGDSPMTIGYGHVNKPVPKLYLSEAEAKLEPKAQPAVTKLLAKKPEDRFATGERFISSVATTEVLSKSRSFSVASLIVFVAVVALVVGFFLLREDGPASWQSRAEHAQQTIFALPSSEYESADFDTDNATALKDLNTYGEKLIGVVTDSNNPEQSKRFLAAGHYYLGAAHAAEFLHLYFASQKGAPQGKSIPISPANMKQMSFHSQRACMQWADFLEFADPAQFTDKAGSFNGFEKTLTNVGLDNSPEAQLFRDRLQGIKGNR